MILSQDIKKGTCIRMDGKLYFCIDFLHVKPGKGNTIMRTTLKDVVSGNVLERRFNIGERLEDVRVERRQYQFLYKEGEDFVFMDQETYEQATIARDQITGVDFLKDGLVVDVVFDASTETILYAELPIKVDLEVTYTEPGMAGNTATNTLKPATVETGAQVRVPLFINAGEKNPHRHTRWFVHRTCEISPSGTATKERRTHIRFFFLGNNLPKCFFFGNFAN